MAQEVLRSFLIDILFLHQALIDAKGSKTLSRKLCVDLGCGTGLGGQQIRRHCKGRMMGIDLSPRMLAVAKKKKLLGKPTYDELHVGDAVSCMLRNVKPGTADLIMAVDVLIYIQDLEGLFSAAEECLTEKGLFAFSTEAASIDECGGAAGPGWVKRTDSERIAHSREYIIHMLQAQSGLEIASLSGVVLRNNGNSPVDGDIWALRKMAAR